MAKSKTKKVTAKEIELLEKKVELLEKEVALKEKESDRQKMASPQRQQEKDLEEYKKSKTMYKWKAPVRVFVKRDRKWFLTIGLVTLFLIFLLILVDKPFLIIVILATVFLTYVLAIVDPEVVEHVLTNKGLYSFRKLFRWGDLRAYWFAKMNGQNVLYVNTKSQFNPRIIALVGKGSMTKINNILQKYIPYHFIKAQNRLSRLLDGEYVKPKDVPGKTPVTNEKD